MKFKILPKKRNFTINGVLHLPGEIIDLPTSYLGEKWLKPVEEPKKAKAPVAISEPEPAAPVEEKSAVPLGTKMPGRKKSRSS